MSGRKPAVTTTSVRCRKPFFYQNFFYHPEPKMPIGSKFTSVDVHPLEKNALWSIKERDLSVGQWFFYLDGTKEKLESGHERPYRRVILSETTSPLGSKRLNLDPDGVLHRPLQFQFPSRTYYVAPIEGPHVPFSDLTRKIPVKKKGYNLEEGEAFLHEGTAHVRMKMPSEMQFHMSQHDEFLSCSLPEWNRVWLSGQREYQLCQLTMSTHLVGETGDILHWNHRGFRTERGETL